MKLKKHYSKRSQTGQAAIEFVIIAGIVIALYFLMIAIALIWHGHHLNNQLALEAASYEGTMPGAGAARVADISQSWMPGYQITVSGIGNYTPESWFLGEGLIVNTFGIEPEFIFFGADNDGFMRSAISVPTWEFVPGDD